MKTLRLRLLLLGTLVSGSLRRGPLPAGPTFPSFRDGAHLEGELLVLLGLVESRAWKH